MRKLLSSMLGLFLLTGCSHIHSSQWEVPDTDSHWFNEGGRDGNYYSQTTPQLHPHLLWSRNTHAQIMSSAVISAYNLVTFTNNASTGCTIFTLMLDSGRKDFCRNLTRENSKNFPLVDKFGNIYTGTLNQLLAYDWYGPIRWGRNVQGTPISSQFIAPDILVTLTDSGIVYVLEAHLGKILSEINIHLLTNETFSSPIHVDRKTSTVWVNSDLSVYALQIKTVLPQTAPINPDMDPTLDPIPLPDISSQKIHLLWQFHQASKIRQAIFAPNFHAGYLLGSNNLEQINLTTEQLDWKYDIADTLGVSTDRNGNIFVTSQHGLTHIKYSSRRKNDQSNNTFFTVEEKWNQPISHILSHPIALANGNVLMITHQFKQDHAIIRLLYLSGDTGKIISQTNFIDKTNNKSTSGEISIANDGIVIITLSDGEVLGIK